MKVKIIRDTVAGGQPVVVGQVVDMPANEAAFLISIKKAVALTEKSAPEIKTADLQPEVETADVKAPKRKKQE